MDSVILFSHGSLLCGAGEALENHAARLRERGIAPLVAVAYLNYNEPTFLQSVQSCAEAGATRIRVAPYFLIPGKFVKVDLPKQVAEAQSAFPAISFEIADALGFDERLADALIESANGAAPDGWRVNLERAQQSCRPDPQCPLYNTPFCPKHPGEDAPRLGDE